MYYVYIISNAAGIYYKGFTSDPGSRLQKHYQGETQSTRGKGPWKLIFIRVFDSKTEALRYEKMLKRQNHKYLDWRVKQSFNTVDKWNAGGRLG